MKRIAISSDYSFGVILVVVSAITFSTAGLFTKGVEAAPWDIIFWRGVFGAGFTFLWTCYRGQLRENFPKMGASGVAVAIVGGLGTAAFIAAFKLTTIANVSMIYAVAPLFAALLAWAWIGEKMTFRVLVGSLIAIVGVAIILSGSLGEINLAGDGLALCMALAMALIIVIYRKFPNTPGAGPAVLSSLLLLPIAFFFGEPLKIPYREIALLSAFGLVFAIASVTLAEGAKRVPSGQTALLSTLEVVLAPVLAFLILTEIPPNLTVVGGAFVFFAVMLTVREGR